ncbi:hypothetical protein LOH54_03180 [Sulfurimonas sp. HSL-3221]|nr:hypothetical protein [Sulfurimonas sp. HSL-3221]UFS63135.1 hypothetical protein LOH54_03180 [Sulfurimonas sp. HSL-3221]
MNDKTKQIIKIVLLLAGSAFFLFQGFSLLFTEQDVTPEKVEAVMQGSAE